MAHRSTSSSVVSIIALGVGDEPLPLVGVRHERVHAVADRVARGLVAGDAEQQEEHVELELVELVAVDLGVEQRRDDVLAGFVLRLQLVGVRVELGERLVDVGAARRELGVVAADHLVRPVEDARSILERDAHHLGDRLQRQLGRELGDEVALAPLADAVDDDARAVLEVVLEQVRSCAA